VPHGVGWIPIRDQDGGGLGRQLWAATADDPGAAASAMVRALQDEVTELGPARLPLAPARQG
jgi:hypothetical protein